MKILHIWNTAGIGSILSKYLNKIGFESNVIERKQYDSFGYNKYYNNTKSMYTMKPIFILRCITECMRYDVIHVHALLNIIPKLRKVYRNKKIIFHAHGSDLRLQKQYYINHVKPNIDRCIVSTPDLLMYDNDAVYLPNIVDTELFKVMENCRKNKEWLLLYDSTQFNTDLSLLDDADIIDRAQLKIPYSYMCSVLNHYNGFVDIKIPLGGETAYQAYSTTGLQALACGLKVINYQYREVTGLPYEHTPCAVINRLEGIYRNI